MNTRKEIMILAFALASAVAAASVGGSWKRSMAFLAGWVLPGAGHVLMGKWKKGLFFFALLGAAYAFGMHIAGWRPVSFDDNPFYFVGQYGSGATLLVAKLRGSEKAILSQGIHPSWFDPGLLYVCVVGLLNLVLMLNVLDLKTAAAPAAAPAATPPAAPPPPPAPEKTA
jgi:Family of unknown function (DUF6677)